MGFNDGSVTLSHDGSQLFLGQSGNHVAGGVYASYTGGLVALSNPINSSSGGVVNMNFVPVSSAAFHVGVGTLTPSANLHVVGNVYSSGNVEASKFIGDGSLLTGISLTGTGAITVPSGTTAQRPATGVVGMLRYNSTTGNMEAFTGSGWVNL